MDFFDQVGKMALGSRLRRLSERVTEDAAQLYQLYDNDFQPKWFPVFYVLSQGQSKTITSVAESIGHSHPSVSKIVREMSKKGLVLEEKDPKDARRNIISLTPKGLALFEKLDDQFTDVRMAVEETSKEASLDLWKAIDEWEYLLSQKSLLTRVIAQRKKREAANVRIVAFESKYQTAFRDLNEAWISKYFKMESADYKALDDPEGYILQQGGHILVALYRDEPVGVCALLKMNDPEYEYELGKMAVSPAAQGKNIGWLLGQAILEKAKSLGARAVFLESNTILKPAISLYLKLGFQKISGRPSPYERANIQMGVVLNGTN